MFAALQGGCMPVWQTESQKKTQDTAAPVIRDTWGIIHESMPTGIALCISTSYSGKQCCIATRLPVENLFSLRLGRKREGREKRGERKDVSKSKNKEISIENRKVSKERKWNLRICECWALGLKWMLLIFNAVRERKESSDVHSSVTP